jgi:hypothetical protein
MHIKYSMVVEIFNNYIGKNVKRKNLRGGYRHYIVLSYSDLLGYTLFEPKTDTRCNVKSEVFEKQFKIVK